MLHNYQEQARCLFTKGLLRIVLVGTRHCRLLIAATNNSDATANDISQSIFDKSLEVPCFRERFLGEL